jgi:hypothetical protein
MLALLQKYKRILIIIGVLIVTFIIYSHFKGSGGNNQPLTASSNTGIQNPAGQQFFNQLLTLQHITLDDRIFADPRFQSLEDFSQPLPDEPEGRPNPFAPIGVDVAGGVSTSSAGTGGFGNLNFTSGGATPLPPR